jgi:peptidoglycan L-alanyl-D-glutamate endopeptidase CwlK
VFVEYHYNKLYPNDPIPFLTCTHRDNAEQSELYAQGRTTGKMGKIVTNAKAGQSPHNYKPALAFDVAFKKKDGTLDWNPKLFIKLYGIIQGNYPGLVKFGGDFKFKDYPHYELLNWEKYITLK